MTPDTAGAAEAPAQRPYLPDALPIETGAARSAQGFPTVAIGASAGGIEALQGLFRAMPRDSGCAFVVVMHLSPDFPSELVSVLARASKLPVRQAEDGMVLAPNRIHVIAPGTLLGIDGGRLRVRAAAAPSGRPHTVDHFMTELAADQRERAIAIVLSGTDGDGTVGVKAIKGEGGLTIVQLPSTAAFPSMPNSAVASGMVDLQLAVEAMPEAIVGYLRGARLHQPLADDEPQELLSKLLDLLHRQLGLDFSGYKQPMLVRRVHRRMGLLRCASVDDYMQTLRDSRAECEALAEDFLISVTEFFREPDAWQVLADEVLPDLLAAKHTGDAVRVWVPGCATGEEAYGLAMLFLENPLFDQQRLKLQIFATDLDRGALDVARKGCYPRTIEATVSAQRLERFFVLEHEVYRVRRALRDAITFAAQNLAYDPPFSRMDLVSCRNLLIYLSPELQRRVLQVFHYALVPGGVLALGKSETVAPLGHLFRTVAHGARIFRRIGAAAPPDRVPRLRPLSATHAAAPPSARVLRMDHARVLHDALGAERPTCALLANREGRVLYLHGVARGLVDLHEGEPSSDLFAMVDGALRPHLRAAMHLAAAEKRRVETHAAAAAADGTDARTVRVAVAPLPHEADDLLLVTLDPEQPAGPVADPAQPGSEQQALRSLEAELHNTKRDLRLAIEEMEATNEELKVAHEEAISTNEELQSTNEELETSQEELQSVNEELTTVNHQLQVKLEELEGLNDDLSNLLASTSIPTLFLDRDLRIKRFTPAATQLFRLIGSDVERPLADIVTLDDADAVIDDARAVLRDLTPLARETVSRDGRSYLRRTLPYRKRENQIDGVVITFNDVTQIKQAAEGLRRLAAVMQGSRDAIVVHDLGGHVLAWNEGARAMYGYDEAEALQHPVGELLAPDSRAAYEGYLARALRGEAVHGIELKRLRRDGSTLDVSTTLSVIRDEAGAPQAVSLIERDITPNKRAERQLRESEHRFRTLADNAPVLIWMSASDGVLRFVNRHFAQFVGHDAAQLQGRALPELMHDDDQGTLQSGLVGLRPGHDRFEAQLRLRHADGASRWTRCTALLQPEPLSGRSQVVGTFLDVDAQVRSEELLIEASRHKDEFLAMLGHELRNPLAPIRNAAEVLLRVAPADQRLTWAHDVLVRQVSNVTRLVDDLLDISLITRGAMQLRVEPVDLSATLARAVEDVQPLLRRKKHRFEAQLPERPVWVEGDQFRLTQVFVNLLTNAAKYTDEHGEIRLATWLDDGHVLVRVSDNGLGIAPEMRSRIFDLFVQDQRSIDRSQGGLGIGLALVKHLVVKQGGTVEAQSAGLGRGSEFTVCLPRLKDAPAGEPGATEAGAATQHGRVLVVDDDRESGESMAMLLELNGYQVQCATDLASALEVAARFRPQLAVMDIALPGADGYEVARRLRAMPEIGAGLRVIGLSGFARPADFERGRRAGFSAYFAKPVDPVELDLKIAELLAVPAASS
jgi:two-component system CheB/CheR fusion protein